MIFIQIHFQFFQHNLATDSSFIEANLIICRNVLIYFNKNLQGRVFDLFNKSLVPGGVLGLGSKETLKTYKRQYHFEANNSKLKIYTKRIDGND